MKVLLVFLWLGLCAAHPQPDLCQQLEDGQMPDDVDLEEVNECYECDWHKLTLSAPSSDDVLAPPGVPGDVARCQDSPDDGIRIALGRSIKVGGIEISGDGDGNWIEEFTVTYLDSHGNSRSAKNEDGNTVFDGNSDDSSSVERRFFIPVEVTELRIKALAEHNTACAKIDVFACDYEDDEDDEEGAGMGENSPMANADGSMFDFGRWLLEYFRKAYCSVDIVTDCFNKCAKYKNNLFGCVTCDCEVPKKDEKLEGDILATRETYKAYEAAMGIGQQQRGASSRVRKWPKQGQYYMVPYTTVFSAGTSAANAINQAIADFNRHTCIRLTPRRGQRAYIRFFSGGGCFSPVGMQSSGNSVSLGRGCHQKGTVIHEVMHSLGFWHEQSRPDRDNHVEIRFANISPNMRYNFQKRTTSEINSFGSRYDVGSIMHYGGYAFSSNRQPTIIDKKTRRAVRAQRSRMASTDIEQINKMYPCNNNPGPTTATTTTVRTVRPSCRDRISYCSQLLSNRFFRYDCNSRVMRYWCRKTCRAC